MINFRVRYQEVDRQILDEAIEYGQFILDNLVIQDSNYFIPMDTHTLERSALINTRLGSGLVVWQTPYARKLYYNTNANFSKDQNPNARALWFEAAKAQKRDIWLEKAELAVKSKL